MTYAIGGQVHTPATNALYGYADGDSTQSVEYYEGPCDTSDIPETHEPQFEPPHRRGQFDWVLDVASTALILARKFFLVVCLVLAATITACAAVVAPHWWITDYETSFMANNPNQPIIRQWVDIDHISRHTVAAAIVFEDLEFGDRKLAFDVNKFVDTAMQHVAGENPDGGSTIPQQLAKNLYLTDGRSALRKAIEAPLSMTMNVMLSDERTLELYLNYAQFGPSIYGVCAASWYYFDTPPWSMSEFESAQLAAILPLPSEARRADGGGIFVLGPESSEKFRVKVYEKAPNDLAWVGGYQPLMDQVGIEGTASDHAGTRGEDSCSTMPSGVKSLLMQQGYK